MDLNADTLARRYAGERDKIVNLEVIQNYNIIEGEFARDFYKFYLTILIRFVGDADDDDDDEDFGIVNTYEASNVNLKQNINVLNNSFK